MFNILPVRKFIRFVSSQRGLVLSLRRDRVPASLPEDLDKNITEKSPWQKYIFMFIFLLMYIIHFLAFNYNNKTDSNLPVFKSAETANASTPLIGPDQAMPFCFVDIRKLGNFSVNKTVTKIPASDYSTVQIGGYYTPEKCRSRHKLAILVPFRDREENLVTFLFNIHPFLIKQKLEYRIFVIEQKGIAAFNRGRLFNAGFQEAMKFGSWKCLVLHDVDLLPLNERIMYSCPIWPRLMCSRIEHYKPFFHTYFGGVSAISVKHFEKVNGFSNLYWGWGSEDTDLYWRIRTRGFPVVTYNRSVAVYTALNHIQQPENSLRYILMKTAAKRCHRDGLSSLQYSVDSVTLHHLYTHILVDIDPTTDYDTIPPLTKSRKGRLALNLSLTI